MRRFVLFASVSLIAFFSSLATKAQVIKDPTHWTYEVKKVGVHEYQLQFKVSLEKGWHIWSMNPGGDGMQIIPTFIFTENKTMKVKGNMREQGKKITTIMEGVDGKVSYYADSVIYTQYVSVLSPTTIKGTHQYQVCNDQMCLPPTEVPFSFPIQ